MRLGHDISNYAIFTVDDTGILRIDPTENEIRFGVYDTGSLAGNAHSLKMFSFNTVSSFNINTNANGYLSLNPGGSGDTQITVDADSDFSVGDLFVQGSSDNIGIGTISPWAKLDVRGEINVESVTENSSIFFKSHDTAGDTGKTASIGVQDDDNQGFYVSTDAGYSLSVNQSGNVGVGVSIANHKLQVNGTIAPVTTDADLGTSSLKWDAYLNEVQAEKVTISDIIILPKTAAAPASPVEGQIYIDSTDNHIYCYINSGWRRLDN